MEYRCRTASIEGFVQYLAANLLPSGYWFYVTGWAPEHKNVQAVDQKLIAKYGTDLSRQARSRRKRAGRANVQYLRFGRFFLLIATHGEHRFFEEEGAKVRDIRRISAAIGNYSVSYKRGGYKRRTKGEKTERDDRWHARVRICRRCYVELKALFLEAATRLSADELARELQNVPFEPYAPVRQQLLNILRLVNRSRRAAGLARVPSSAIRCRRRIVLPFAADDKLAEVEVGGKQLATEMEDDEGSF